jgi:hypothetical protein
MDKLNNAKQIDELLKTDFSSENDSKEKIFGQLLTKIENQKFVNDRKGYFTMKKLFKKPVFATAVIAVFVMGVAMSSYGQGFYRVIKEVLVGEHAKYVVTEQSGTPDLTLPDELKGKLYDKNGIVLEQFPEDGKIYNQGGEEVKLSSDTSKDENGGFITKWEVLTEKEYNERQNSEMTTMTDPEKAKSYLAFDFSLPGYMPEGYVFDRIQLFNDQNGKPIKNCKYTEVYFSNGDRTQDLYLQLRLMDEETAYEADIGNVEEIEINGNKGIISEGNIDVKIDGVMYMFRAGASGVSNEQLIQMAESIHR